MFKVYSLILLLIAMPSLAKETLTVYTTNSFASEWGPGPAIKKAFEAECNCELTLLAVSDGVAVLNRLQMEGEKTKADLVLGLDNNLITSAQKTGLFAVHKVNTEPLSLPIHWDNDHFVPYDYGYFAFIYHQEKLKAPPKSLDELINSPIPWRIIYQDPRTSTPGFGLVLWMQKIYGDQTANAWQKLAKKTVTVTKDWSSSYGLFLKGEADFVLSYTTSPVYHIIEENNHRYAAASFEEGHYLQVEVMGRLATSPHAELADRFIQFMLTPASQRQMMSKNWMYPVITIPVPKVFTLMVTPKKTLEYRPQEVADKRTEWLKSWQNTTSR